MLDPKPGDAPTADRTDGLGTGTDPGALERGRVVAGRYEVQELVGRGGFGWVYRAVDRQVGETVALKFLRIAPGEDADAIDGALREIRAARRVTHSNVIRLHDLGEDGGFRFLSMEYVEGEPLQRAIARRGALPVGEGVRIFRQVVAGVDASHRRGVVHRDLKPGNILLGVDGTVKVLDFGIATLAGGGGTTLAGRWVGTPEYMAPEQVEGRGVNEAGDVYALGVILYEMLTGRLPFRGETPIATAMARLARPPEDPCWLNPAIPSWVGRIVLRCLAKEPADRFPSAGPLADALDAGGVEEDGTETATLLDGRRFSPALRARGARLLRFVPVALTLAGIGIAAPSVWRAVVPNPGSDAVLLADGIARVVVADFEALGDDPGTRLIATALAEALRARLARRSDVKLLAPAGPTDLSTSALRGLGAEQVLSGRLGRLGGEIRVMVAVSDVRGRERWMTYDRSADLEETWDSVEALAGEIEAAYAARLEIARKAR